MTTTPDSVDALPPLPEVSAHLYQAHYGMAAGFKLNTVHGETYNQPKEGEYTKPGPLFTAEQMHEYGRACVAATQVAAGADMLAPLATLLAAWERRSRDALPADAMLINKHVRELREVCGAQNTKATGQPSLSLTDAPQAPAAVVAPEVFDETKVKSNRLRLAKTHRKTLDNMLDSMRKNEARLQVNVGDRIKGSMRSVDVRRANAICAALEVIDAAAIAAQEGGAK